MLTAAKGGDGGAFNDLQRDLEPLLRRFLRRLVGGLNSEDDVLQNAFLALFTNLERIESEAHLLPFLYRVTRNLAYDELRRRGRYRTADLDEAARHLADRRTAAPDEVVSRTMAAVDVSRALLCLPEAQRQALLLYGQEGLSYEQVAEATSVDVGTVKSRIHYGRRRLRQLLSSETLATLAGTDNAKGEASNGGNR